MSQYRQDGGGGPTTNSGGTSNVATAAGPGPNGAIEAPDTDNSGTAAAGVVSTSGPGIPPPDSNSAGAASSVPTGAAPYHHHQDGGPSGVGPPPPTGPQEVGHAYPPYPAYGGSAGPAGSEHAFGPRQQFGNPKQAHPSPAGAHRFMPAPPLTQPAGPTPTLNQLLQNPNPVPHRYQNNYTHPEQHYNQWPQKHPPNYGPGPAPPPGPYRQQQSFCPTYGGAGAGSTPSGYDSRTSWPGGPPGSPGQPQPQQTPNSQPQNSTSSVPVSQPSPQPPISHSPGPGPGPGGQMPPSPQHNHHQQPPPGHQPGFPSRPPPPTTPNTHGPDPADLSGGNSNDSSGGPAPGTPNSQSMRPTPSPTGSTGSRSMSPAVGQNIPMPPRPSSSQSDGGGGGGSGGGGGPPQRLSHSPMPPYGPPGQQGPHPGGPPYKGQPQNSSQMPMYQHQPGQYPGPGGQPGAYPPRPPGNFGPGAAAAAAAAASGAAAQGQGYGPQPGCPSPGPNLRPPHYLKHHLQHKMAFGSGVPPGSAPPSPGPPQNFHMAPPGHHHSGMGPPPSMGPPMLTNNHPHEGGPMPPPSSTPNSHPPQMMNEMLDNGITTTPQSSMNTHVVSAASAGSAVTSVVTTGPDGTPIDEGSQQSTLSNASAASGEDTGCPQTPKSNRKNDMGGHYSHPSTPQGATSHEDYGEITSPGWPPRTPASPKTDSLSKLYEMDDSPDRKVWLDKLLGFMEERRTPITTCPTISKNPLDLFRLYMYVKERGGFMEVTNNKTWKDIAGLLGIGASSSAAYTLRKHYTKNLLFYECQFDRGGIDPQPIINKVEASSKKKGAKAASVPSPGSSNSQDSFLAGGGSGGGGGGSNSGPPSGASLDGYGGYNGYPPSNNPEYPQRPSSQSTPSPHAGSGGANHLNNAAPGGPSPAGGAADNVSVSNPFDDVSPSPPPPRGGPFAGGPHPPYPTGYPPGVRPVYPYSGESSGAVPGQPNSGQTQPPSSSPQDPYRYNANPPGGYNSRPPYGGAQGAPGAPPAAQGGAPAGYSPHQDYYRQDQNSYPGVGPPNKNMPPPGQQPPRRHPDFTKDQAYPPYGQPPRAPMYGGWPNNNQYRPPPSGQYGNTASNQGPPPPQQWNQGSGVNPGARPGGGPWQNNQGYQQPQQPQQQGSQPGQNQWQPLPNQGGQAGSPMRPVQRPGKPFPPMMPPGGSVKGSNQQPVGNSYGHGQMPKREITFPPDSVENVTPVLYRRKRICRADVGHVDAWRLIMCLRSGLLSESTYALDMLNILLFDDTSVPYFGLNQWPGLLDLLLEHFKRNLADMFDGPYPPKDNLQPEPMNIDLGSVVEPVDPCKKILVFNKTTNYSLVSRRGDPVKFVDRPDDLFVKDNLKDWDTRGDVNVANTLAEIPSDPWYTNAEHILPNFQAEFGRIPFHTRLDDQRRLRDNDETKVANNATSERVGDLATPATTISTPAIIASVPPPKVISKKPARTKTLSDVISRIKKESSSSSSSSSEDNEKAIGMEVTSVTSENVKTEPASENSSNCEESASSSVDLNVSMNGECGTNTEKEETLPNRVKEEKDVKPCDDKLKRRRRLSDYEDESYSRDDASLVLLTESQDNLGKRCVCISNILRSLTFVPGNEIEFARSITYLALVGKLLLLQHEHPPRTQKTRNYDREEDADFADSCSSLQGEHEWWWDFLAQIRENILVGISNIAGQIDCSQYEEEVARPLLDGLLHWAICPSATAQDPFASVGPASCSSLSPQRLALEALCKLCVTNSNVDLVIATPPFIRLEKLCAVLTKHLCRSEDQVLREFSINLLHYLAAADSAMSRVVAAQSPCVSLLVAFIEQAEQTALEVANQRGIAALRDNPDSMGTSLDMLRRAAATLVFLSRHPDNKPLLMQQESRLLALVMSQILDQQVATLISNVLFQISRC